MSMNEVLRLILSLSLSGSILALIIFVLKPIIKHKLSQTLQYYIWLIVLLRLIIPLSFEGSLMNRIFNRDAVSNITVNQTVVQPAAEKEVDTNSSIAIPNAQQNVEKGVYKNDTDHSRYLKDLFYQNVLYLWLIGIVFSLVFNLLGYARFMMLLKKGSIPADEMQYSILNQLKVGRKNLKMIRNRYVTTPMLVGIIRPCIVIPDMDLSEVQIKNILLHEITHLKRFDIGIKWLTMIVTSIHWFNPVMYLIKREINNSCELACDETVIKNLNSQEKQAYGDTLISVVSEQAYPVGVLQATMCEEKKSLKERLVSIMSYSKKSKFIVIISLILVISTVAGAVALGASVGNDNGKPPKIYISKEDMNTPTIYAGPKEVKIREGVIGTNSWGKVQSDYPDPLALKYNSNNVVNVGKNDRIIISTQKGNQNNKHNFTLEKLLIYRNRYIVKGEAYDQGGSPEFRVVKGNPYVRVGPPGPQIINGNLYTRAPSDPGEYVYSLTLNYGNKGTVNYGFVVRVDMMTFELEDISKYRTPYVGNASKVLGVVGNLPVPDGRFIQRFISLETDKQPYGLNVFYEVNADSFGSEWTDVITSNEMSGNLQKNALVIFSMIDNLDMINFAFRNSQSGGELDSSKYQTPFSVKRTAFEERYGDLSIIGKDLDLLYKTLENEKPETITNEFSEDEIEAARNVVIEYFRAVKAKDDKAILKTLTHMHNTPKTVLYGEEDRTLLSERFEINDPMRESYLKHGRGFNNNAKKENVIVFKVNFNVKYPKGTSGAFNEGDYENWNMILVREDKTSPWLIDGQGY